MEFRKLSSETYLIRLQENQVKLVKTLLIMLETRLDNVVFRLGFASSRKEARQLVVHGHSQ